MATPTRGRPRAEPRHEQRRRIVAAARAAFARHGYDGVTLSAIATAARVPRSVVYELVGGKEQLLGAAAEQVAAELVAAVDERYATAEATDRPLEELVRDDIHWFIETFATHAEVATFFRLSVRFASQHDDPAGRARRHIEDRLTRLHIDRAQSFGLSRDRSARLLTVVLFGMLENVMMRAPDEPWDPDAVADLVAEFALGGYLRTEIEGFTQAFEDEA